MSKIKKILIANRGEIAMRIIRTAKNLGIKTVAVYSEADAHSPVLDFADESYLIGPAPSSQSYLDVDKILDVITQSGADAVHPGYGFLSENEGFVRTLEERGIIFIGPSSAAISQMGDKVTSKKIAVEAGVSVVPGFLGEIKGLDHALEISNGIGFPIIIKASAGGGGKGMKIVYNEGEVAAALQSAQNEARNSFKDDRVFIEKYIESPRHIEIQVIGDKFGNVVCLGERECSIQRNNQKIIEESPSCFVDEKTRQAMYEQSVMLAKKVGYYSAGTVEYIMDKNRNFYFLEMNTRIQVEHPVTEYVTKLDLIEQMIRVAEDRKLPFTQSKVTLSGWSIECRIYAEDPRRGFLPSSGRIMRYSEPKGSYHTRIDSGIVEGSEISPYYDPMIAKLITYGDTRNEAIARMKSALNEYTIEGVVSNIDFLEAIMQNDSFVSGKISTGFIKSEYPEGFKGVELSDFTSEMFLISAICMHYMQEEKLYSCKSAMRLTPLKNMPANHFMVSIDDVVYPTYIYKNSGGDFDIRCQDKLFKVETEYRNGDKVFKARVNKQGFSVRVSHLHEGYLLNHNAASACVTVRPPIVQELGIYMPKVSKKGKMNSLVAPISGNIVAFKVAQGDVVSAGGELVVIEAMKMENVIRAEDDCVIKAVKVSPGTLVSTGDLLIEFQEGDVE